MRGVVWHLVTLTVNHTDSTEVYLQYMHAVPDHKSVVYKLPLLSSGQLEAAGAGQTRRDEKALQTIYSRKRELESIRHYITN